MKEEWGQLLFEAKAENDQTHQKIEFKEALSFYERGILISPWMQPEFSPRKNDYYKVSHIFVPYDQIDEINIMNENPDFFEGLGGKIPRITVKTNNQKMYNLNFEEFIYYSELKNNYWRNMELVYRFFIKIKRILFEENSKQTSTISKSNFKEIFDMIGEETKIDEIRDLKSQIFPNSVNGAVGGLLVSIPIVILLFYVLLNDESYSSGMLRSNSYIVIIIIWVFTLTISWGVGGWIGGKIKDRIFLLTPILFEMGIALIILIRRTQLIFNGSNGVDELLIILHWISISVLLFFIWFGLYPELRILLQKNYSKTSGDSIAGWTITLLVDAFLFQFILNVPLITIAILFVILGGRLISQADKEEFDKLVDILYYQLSSFNEAINLSSINNLSKYRILNNYHINHLMQQLSTKIFNDKVVVKQQENSQTSKNEYLIGLGKNVKGNGWRTLDERKIKNGKFIFSPNYSFRMAVRSRRYRITENIFSSFFVILSFIIVIGVFYTLGVMPFIFYLFTIVPLDQYITNIHFIILIFGIIGTFFFPAIWLNISLKKTNLRQIYLTFETKVGIFQNGLFLPSWIQKDKTAFNDIFIPFISISDIKILSTWDEIKSQKYKDEFMIITAFRNQTFSLLFKRAEKYLPNQGASNDIKLVYDFLRTVETNIDTLKSNNVDNLKTLFTNSTILV